MTLSDGLNLAVAIGTFSLALAAAYTVASAEYGRRLDARREQVERILDATVDLANAGFMWEQVRGQGPPLEVARRRLHAELQMVGVTGYESTELMVRPTAAAKEIVDQSEAALLEIGDRLDDVAPRSLLAAVLLRRRPHRREVLGGNRI